MNELKVIENELVPVYETSTGEKVVYGTELHTALEVKSNYREWINRRISDCEAIENEDFQAVEISTASGQKQKQHIIKLDTAKEMAMLERNDKGKEVRRYFIKVEKKYKQSVIDTKNLSPELQMFKQIFDSVARNQLELQQMKETSERIEQKVESIKEVISLDTTSWRDDTSNLIKKIAKSLDGGKAYQDVRAESYELLNKRMGVDVKTRLTNKRRRMADEGVCKSKRDKLSYLDVIADDKKLIEGYVAIVKEMAIKYGVDIKE